MRLIEIRRADGAARSSRECFAGEQYEPSLWLAHRALDRRGHP